MGKLTKVYDETFKKGAHSDDAVTAVIACLNDISHKPEESESKLVNGDVGEFSYFTIYDKKFRIVLYIEE